MLCDKCKKNEATVHVSRNINGNLYEQNLCHECAGVPEDMFSALGTFGGFSVMRGMAGLDHLLEDLKEMSVIPAAGTRQKNAMQESNFEELGLKLPDVCKPLEAADEMLSLRAKLDAAVKAQEYEKAAEIRDKIYFMEKERKEKDSQ